MIDSAKRFYLGTIAVRGAYVLLSNTIKDATDSHHYPQPVQTVLSEFMAANAVIAELTCFEGILSLQARSDRGIKLMLSEHNIGGTLRAIARDYQVSNDADFEAMLGGGILTLNLDPKVGQRYQGIIKLDDGSLAISLSHYFKQSEQLNTHIILRHTPQGIAALMLQAMPDTAHSQLTEDSWDTIVALANTLSADEADTLEADNILYRLFHEYEVRSENSHDLRYQCTCSRKRVGAALKNIAESELRKMIEEDGQIEANCDFCNTAYTFYHADIDRLLGLTHDAQPTLH